MARKPEYDGPAALRIDETHPFLRERLAAVTPSFSWYHHFGAAVDIAWCWLALGRVAEARALADELADGIPAEAIHNLWSPASSVICLAARLARQANDAARHGELIVRIATTRDYVTPADRHHLEDNLSRSREALEPHRVPGPLKRVCDDITDALSQAVYFAETLRAGRFRWQQWLSLDEVEATMSDGLQLLGDHLAGRIALPQRLDVDPVPEHTGVLLVDATAIPADNHCLWWIELATGSSGRVEHARYMGDIVAIRDASAAWLLGVRDEEGPGASLVERSSSSADVTITSTFVLDFDVRALSPNGRHAVMIDPRNGSLVMAVLAGTQLTPLGALGVTAESWNTTVLACLDDGSAVIRIIEDEVALVQRFAVGVAPSLLVRAEARTEAYVASDASVVVTIRGEESIDEDDADNEGAQVELEERELTIHYPRTGASPKMLRIGRGNVGPAAFAPGNRYFVLSLDDDDGTARVIAIDLAAATYVELIGEAAQSFTIAPDGRFVIVWNMTLLIVPIEGGTPRKTNIEGIPCAWLR